ncbi:MarR family winged helix-turn-helix transcriptional regulator [Pseudomonas sp. HK3]|jgi:DNA-binding MarR family transcriptional regulator
MEQSLSSIRDTHLGRMLLKLERQFTRQVLEKLASDGITGITLRHFVVIPYVDDKGIRATEIARQAGVSKQAVSKLIDELVDNDYLEIKADPADKRASLVFISEKGREFLQLAIAHTKNIEKKWATKVGEKDFATMKLAMRKILLNDD